MLLRKLIALICIGALSSCTVLAFEKITLFLLSLTSGVERLSLSHLPQYAGSVFLSMIVGLSLFLASLLQKKTQYSKLGMADEVISLFHQKTILDPLKGVTAKLLSSILTIGLHASAGLEGASKWVGGITALIAKKNIPTQKFKFLALNKLNPKSLLAAGSAAGLTVAFRSPFSAIALTLESPYHFGIARNYFLPATISALSACLILRFFLGSFTPILSIGSELRLDTTHFLCAITIGISTSIGAKTFLSLTRFLKKQTAEFKDNPAQTLPIAVTAFFFIALFADSFDLPSSKYLGPGLKTIEEIFFINHSFVNLLMILFFKIIATSLTFSLGGVGGLFIPSCLMGACIGAIQSILWLHHIEPGFVLLGMSSFIGASYNALLTSIIFTLENGLKFDFFENNFLTVIQNSVPLLGLCLVSNIVSYKLNQGNSNCPSQEKRP